MAAPSPPDVLGRERLRAAVGAGAGGKAAELVTLVLLATVVPRVLGADDYGRFSVPLTVVTLVSLAMTLGGHTVLSRYVPAVAPEERMAAALAIGRRLAVGRGLQVAALAVAAAIATAVAPDRFPPGVTALVVAAVAANVAATLGLQVALGLGRTGPWSIRYAVHNTVLVAVVLAGAPLVAILAAGLATLALAAVIVGPALAASGPATPVPAGAIRFGVFQAVGAALAQVSQRGGVIVVAVVVADPAETGSAALCTGAALGATYAVLQLFSVTLPHLSTGPGAAAEQALRRLATTLTGVTVVAALLGVLALDATVPAVFGADFTPAVAAFGPALALVVLAPLNAMAVQVSALRLRPEAVAAAGVASLTAFAVVASVAVPAWGAAGATSASLAGAAAGAATAARLLPGAVGARLGTLSTAGTVAVVAVAVVA